MGERQSTKSSRAARHNTRAPPGYTLCVADPTATHHCEINHATCALGGVNGGPGSSDEGADAVNAARLEVSPSGVERHGVSAAREVVVHHTLHKRHRLCHNKDVTHTDGWMSGGGGQPERKFNVRVWGNSPKHPPFILSRLSAKCDVLPSSASAQTAWQRSRTAPKDRR